MKLKKLLLSFLLVCLITNGVPLYAKESRNINMMQLIMSRRKFGDEATINRYQRLTGNTLNVIREPFSQYRLRLIQVIDKSIPVMPDIFEMNELYTTEYFSTFKKWQKLHDLAPYIKKYPELSKISHKYEKILGENSKVYGFPIQDANSPITIIRKDWLDNLNLEMPTTWEELYAVMKAFTFNDPDGNGKNDTYGCVLPSFLWKLSYSEFLQGSSDDFKFVSGKWVDGFTEPDFEAALIRMKKAIDEDIINYDFFDSIRGYISREREIFFGGKIGIASNCNVASYSEFKNLFKSYFPKAEIEAFCIKETVYPRELDTALVIPKTTKKPQEIFENIIAFMYDGGEGQKLFTHGIEGRDYVYEDNQFIRKLKSFNDRSLINPLFSLRKDKDPYVIPTEDSAILKMVDSKSEYILIKPYSPTYTKNRLEIEELRREILDGILIQKKYGIKEGLALYKQKAKELQVEQILKEFNAWR